MLPPNNIPRRTLQPVFPPPPPPPPPPRLSASAPPPQQQPQQQHPYAAGAAASSSAAHPYDYAASASAQPHDANSYGSMDGSMSAYGASSSSSAQGGQQPSIARNISATLLGEGEPDEPPILVELGIDFDHIKEKTKLVLWPKRAKLASTSPIVMDDDFAGPLLFCLALASLLVFQGKIYFGNIYGVFLVGLLGIWATLNLMSHKGIDMLRTASVMGYCLLPIVFLAALSIPLDLRGVAGAICIPLCVLWCANAASLFFVAALDADDRRWLLAYPVALFYTCFALITVF